MRLHGEIRVENSVNCWKAKCLINICQSAAKPEREGSETILNGVGLQANGNSKRGTSSIRR